MILPRARFEARSHAHAFTAVEMVSVLALSALILGSIVVGYGTVVRSRPGVATLVTVPLGTARAAAFAYPGQTGTSRNVVTAPHYGMMAQAEELREQFHADVVSATAVFCLPREDVSNYRPWSIPYDPLLHGELDTPQKFREHLVALGVTPMPFRDYSVGRRQRIAGAVFFPYPREGFVKFVMHKGERFSFLLARSRRSDVL